MKKLLLIVMLCFICSACSGGKNADSEKSSIDQFTEQAGKDAAEGIKRPIDKTRKIDEMARERVDRMGTAEDSKDE
jgi:hypothetical protein